MKTRRVSALAMGLAAAGLLALGTLSQAFADEHADGTGTKVLSGCGTLSGSGSGTGHISLDGDVTVGANGQVTVNEDSSQVTVDDSGHWTRSSLAGDNVTYNGNGTLHIHGSSIAADVSGADLTLNGSGCGTATLSGTGHLSWNASGNDNNSNGNGNSSNGNGNS